MYARSGFLPRTAPPRALRLDTRAAKRNRRRGSIVPTEATVTVWTSGCESEQLYLRTADAQRAWWQRREAGLRVEGRLLVDDCEGRVRVHLYEGMEGTITAGVNVIPVRRLLADPSLAHDGHAAYCLPSGAKVRLSWMDEGVERSITLSTRLAD